ncbi:MAG: hypothetical protein M9932_04725 [Xanthobacteraceae bacterium]|nr:hypothetical protein [Xanthobacteraceae bacterium]
MRQRDRDAAWIGHQQARWLRPDADRWIRPDADRFIAPGVFVADVFPGRSRKYNPNQPRVPAGQPGGGRWTDGGGGSAGPMGNVGFGDLSELDDFSDLFQIAPYETDLDGVQLAGEPPEGIGHNQGPPLDEPPAIPEQRPQTRSERMDFVRSAVSWIGRVGRYSPVVGMFLGALDQAEDLKGLTDAIKTANDPPRSLEELQERVTLPSDAGYQDHHIVGQFEQNRTRFGSEQIDSVDNLVRIPTLKHYEINAWYSRQDERFGNLSPRDYLRDKIFDEQRRIGLNALREVGVLR